jgi:predicted acetyltransferase|tara:strand:- start:1364 stop:1882 length:519 start_codon:yes stop_codon:yes gene_type:complete
MGVNVHAAAKEEKGIVENLMQCYLHDFSEFEDLPIRDDGTFEYEYLNHYWQDPNRYPFLIRLDERLSGFALLRFDVAMPVKTGQMDLAEFFIVRSYRRRGVGTEAARQLWDLFPGHWSVRVLQSNKPAYPFWKQAIGAYTGGNFDERREEQMVIKSTTFHFKSNSSATNDDS